MKVNTRTTITFLLCTIVLVTPFYVITVVAVPDSHRINGVPLTDQGDKPWCGPGCAVMILQYWNIKVTLNEAGETIDSEEDGCYTYELERYIEGFAVWIYEFDTMDELKDWIAKDHPVIVCQWWDETEEEGHFRVVTGYDESFVYINDPNGFKTKFTYETFFLLWTHENQYGLAVSPMRVFIPYPVGNRTVSVEVNK